MKLRHDFVYAASAVIALVVVVALNLAFITPSKAENIELVSWTDQVEPTIKKVEALTAEQYLQRTGTNTNFPCSPETTYSRAVNPLNRLLPPTEVSTPGCITAGTSGKYDWNNQSVIPYGYKYRQKLEDPSLSRTFYFGVENTNKIAVISNAYQFFYGGTPTLHVADDWSKTFANFSVDSSGNVTRSRSQPFGFVLLDNAGNPVDVRPNGLSFSANGRYVHAGATNRAQIVIDLESKKVIPFAPFAGMNLAVYSKVSNDGRYVALSRPYAGLKIYDLEKCGALAGEFVSRDCRSRDLYEKLKSYLNTNDLRVRNLDFIGAGNALDVTAESQNTDGSWTYGVYRMYLPNSTPDKYLALGDSFSSGEGAFDYVEATDMFVSDDEYNVCHLSRKSYPYLLQENLRAEWFHSVACSGSESKDVIFDRSPAEYIVDGNPKAKFKIIGANNKEKKDFAAEELLQYFDSLRPGYVPQREFVVKHNPSIVTISMGGNDVAFADIIVSCAMNFATYQDFNCFSDRDEREWKANEIDQKISIWSKNFVDIKNSLGGADPRLYVIGYPYMFKSDGLCGVNVRFDPSETEQANRLTDYLNAAVKVAADAAGVRYVDVSDAFIRDDDYRLCNFRTEFAVNGLDLWSIINECTSAIGPGARACPNSFHPNELGQKLISETILRRTNNLSQEMPHNSNSMTNLIEKRMSFVGDVAITLQNHRVTFQKDIAPALIAKGEKIQINVPKTSDELPAKSGTTATVTAHSAPVVLGYLPISGDGTISGELTLPGGIETGYHRLIISYTDIADNIVEKYMYFYAAQFTADWDGDGINNFSDPCVTAVQSGIDQDEDGIDDACDGEYVKSAQAPQHANTSDYLDTSIHDSVQPGALGAQASKSSEAKNGFLAESVLGDMLDNSSTATSLTFVNKSNESIEKSSEDDFDSEKSSGSTRWLALGGIVTSVLLVSVVYLIARRRNI